ncbi:hypothetical protein BS47DRAFT_1385443 [Hydnum rufescens UP504]|uniref:Cytochrome P450 n=1 Tax=Hydnum rufescens UP504 TaxID=1448309 RepID=A0A9P6AIZ0_9AGAM|nr:hypothetical protein BS47DRAFT_1385443 [Hydnum rufescens UP504]
MKTYASWLYYTELKHTYGDIVSLQVLGQPMIILNSFEAVQDLIVRKTSTFSDRPVLVMCGELVGWDRGIALGRGTRWAMSRKILHKFLGKSAIQDYFESIQDECRPFVARLVSSPGSLMEQTTLFVAKLVLEMAYGLKINSFEDDTVRFSKKAAVIFGEAAQPGAFLVDTFPALKHIPSWFPGAGFQRKAAEWRDTMLKGLSIPHEQAKKDMASGVALPSFTSRVLEDMPDGVTDELLMCTTGSMYGAAVDTTKATICTFVLAMVLHPEVQAKAQKELHAVIGTERLPKFSDRPALPYIESILKEVIRWQPIVPTSIPYRATQDADYEGYYIPEGSILIANSWAISRDEKLYQSPEAFIPERFEGEKAALDPHQIVFGYGKRICPGLHFADAIVWMTITSLLATVHFSKVRDELGNEITPVPEYSGGLVRELNKFPYASRYLSATSAALIQDDAAAAVVP